MIVDELVARIGLELHGVEQAAAAVKSLNSLKGAVLGVGGVLVALKGAMVGIGLSVAETVDQYADFGQAVGASVETIETLTAAAEMSGGSFEDVQRGLKTLTDQAGAAAKGNETSQESFARLGVSVHGANGRIKTADQLINDVADGLAKMKDPASQVNAAIDVLGKGAIKLLPALTTGRKGLQGFRAEMEKIGVVMSENTNRRFQKLGDSIDMLKLRATGVKNILAQAFLPFAEETISKISGFIERNAGGLLEFGSRFASAVTAPFALFSDVIKALPSELIALIAAGAALTAVFAVPAVAVIALAALVALISEDIYKFLHGQPSLIGDVVQEWENFLQVFRDIDAAATGVAAVFARIGRILADIAGVVSSVFGSKRNRSVATDRLIDSLSLNSLARSDTAEEVGGDVLSSIGLKPPSADSFGGLIAPRSGVPASLLANEYQGSGRYQTVGGGSMVHAPQITINGSGLSQEEMTRAAEDAIIRSALEIDSMAGASK